MKNRLGLVGKLALMAAVLTVWSLVSGMAWGEDDHHHQHGAKQTSGKKEAQLSLNKGQKWPTYKVLRTRMHDIHQLVEQNLERIHKGQMSDGEFQTMGGSIEGHINDIFKNCKLAPAADAQLHVILAKMIKNKDLLKKEKASSKQRHQAVEGIMGGLKDYHKYFDEASPRS